MLDPSGMARELRVSFQVNRSNGGNNKSDRRSGPANPVGDEPLNRHPFHGYLASPWLF